MKYNWHEYFNGEYNVVNEVNVFLLITLLTHKRSQKPWGSRGNRKSIMSAKKVDAWGHIYLVGV